MKKDARAFSLNNLMEEILNGNRRKTAKILNTLLPLKYILDESSQPAKSQKVILEEGVFVESALKMQCHIHKNTLLHIAFSVILTAGLSLYENLNSLIFGSFF